MITIGACLFLAAGLVIQSPRGNMDENKPTVRIIANNLIIEKLKQPYEVMIAVWPDGNYVLVTSMSEDSIDIDLYTLMSVLREKGIDLLTCEMIMHNHSVGLCRPSQIDMKTVFLFVRLGYRGKFAIYCNALDKVIEYGITGENNEFSGRPNYRTLFCIF